MHCADGGYVRVEYIPRDELDRLQALPGAVFALVANKGYMFTSAPGKQTLIPARAKGMHGYLPSMPQMATGLIISGAGVRKGLLLPQVRMIDVAPTVAAFLGVELPGASGTPISALSKES